MLAARLALALALFASACAHDVHTWMPTVPDSPSATGTITVLLTKPVDNLTVTVNGTLVADRARSQKVTVGGVPAEEVDVVVVAGAGRDRVDRYFRVDVEPGEEHTLAIAAPKDGLSTAAAAGAISVIGYLVSRALYHFLF